jgi:hypothetical protein
MITKNKLWLSVLLFPFILVQADSLSDSDYIQSWKTTYVNQLSIQEKQILANILHLLHANAIVESKIRQFPTPISRLNQAIRTNIDQYKCSTEDIAMLKTLIDRLSIVVGTREIYNQTLHTCFNHYNQNNIPLIDAALEGIQRYAQAILRDWANQKKPQTQALLKKSSDAIRGTVQHFQGVSNLHKVMSEGQLPLEIAPEDEINKSLLVLSIITQNNPELLAVTENVVHTLNETSDHAAQIIRVGEEIYKQFYIVLYDILMSPTHDQQYATTMFSMHDRLPDEYKSALPHPNHVFEHMLQTAKMYTQTEFSPS